MTIPIPIVANYQKISLYSDLFNVALTLTNGWPHLPVLNTNPFPRAATHKLSKLFGSTYIASSPLRLFSSTNNDSPATKPVNQKDVPEAK